MAGARLAALGDVSVVGASSVINSVKPDIRLSHAMVNIIFRNFLSFWERGFPPNSVEKLRHYNPLILL